MDRTFFGVAELFPRPVNYPETVEWNRSGNYDQPMFHFTTLIAGLALAASIATQGTKPTAADALQGTWLITSINGKAAPEESPQLTLTFAGDKYHQTYGGKVNERGTIKLDAKKKPMTIDLIITEGSDAGKTQLGIIAVTGDTLRAKFDTPGAQQRPTDFTIKEGSLMVEGKKQTKKG